MRAAITFHHLDDGSGPLAFPARTFDAMLRAFADARLPVVDLDRLLAPGAAPGIALCFDDGWRSVLTGGLPVLRAAGVRAHLFLCTGVVEGDLPREARMPSYAALRWGEVEALHRDGVAIESHTHTHPDLRRLDEAGIADELDRADDKIERRIGRRPRYFAYPYGRADARGRRAAASRYAAAFTTRLAAIDDRDDRFALPRLDAHYLRDETTWRGLDGRTVRARLALRRALRTLRGRT